MPIEKVETSLKQITCFVSKIIAKEFMMVFKLHTQSEDDE
jgi:hypothetical protein